jgi:translocation and assembly module TamB
VDDLRRFTGVALTLGADSLALGRLALSRATASFVADSVATGAGAPERGVADAGALGMRGAAAAGVRVRAGRFELRAGTDSGAALAVQGRTTVAAESTVVVLDSTRLTARPGRDYLLAAPARLVARTVNNAVALDSVVLLGPALALAGPMRARLALAGALQDTGAVTGRAALEGVPLADLLAVVGVDTARYAGRVDVGVTLAGTRVDPRLAVRGDARALTLAGVAVERASLEGTYGDRRLQGAMGVFRDGRQLLVANATLPVNLALVPGTPRTVEAPLQGSVRADSLDLALLAALAPSLASDVRGRVRTSLDLSGTWAHPQIFGALRLADGAATVVPAGVRLQALDADVTLRGDTLSIARVFARSGGPGDSLSLGGRVFFGDPQDPRLDLRLAARNFLGIDRPRLATLWGSTPTPLTVTGSYRNALVRGAVRLERGRIAIPELIDKRVVDLNEYRDVVDTTVFRNRSLLPGAPSAFVEGLRLDDVTLTVGNDVWLRSPESNIKLSGTLAVTRAISRDRGRQEAQLALLGALGVERGTYRLDLLPLAQPVFDVEPGTLRFFGSGDLNPTLDVRAVHVVRQLRQTSNRPDVRVQVNIGGTLNQPTLRLSSADEPPIPDTDLISYLVTGEPAAAIFGQAQASDQAAAAASIVSRLAGSLVSGALSRSGPFDIVQVQTGAVTGSASQPGAQTNIASILASTRLGVGGQLGQRTFYTFSTGFCGLRPQEQSQNFLSTFYRGLGFRVERRLTPSVSLQVGLEPGSQQLACLNDNSRFFFQQTPTQGAIDFSKSWSF